MHQLAARNVHVIHAPKVSRSRTPIQSARHLAPARAYKIALGFGASKIPRSNGIFKVAKVAKRIWRATLEAGFPFRMIGPP